MRIPAWLMPNRPARPAICLISEVLKGLRLTPSNLSVCRNTIRRTGRFSPMPMASVATATFVFPRLKRRVCRLLISGGRLP